MLSSPMFRRLEEREGCIVWRPVLQGGNERDARRMARAVGIHDKSGAGRQAVEVSRPRVQANQEGRCMRHGWRGWKWGADEEARALAEATTEVGGNGEVEAETDGETGQGEAMTDTERADEAVAGADEVLIGANRSVQVGTQAQGGSEEVSSACSWSVDHGHRDEVAEQSVPTRRGAFAGWDAQGGELPYRRLHGDELAGDVVRPRPWRAWGGTELGGLSGGGWDGDAPPLPAGSRCATLLDRTDRMARQGVTASASDGNEGGYVGSGTDSHTLSHTHTHGVLGRLLDRVAEGWARVRSAFGDG